MSDIIVTYPKISYEYSVSHPLTPEELEWENEYEYLLDKEMLNQHFNQYGVFRLENNKKSYR